MEQCFLQMKESSIGLTIMTKFNLTFKRNTLSNINGVLCILLALRWPLLENTLLLIQQIVKVLIISSSVATIDELCIKILSLFCTRSFIL